MIFKGSLFFRRSCRDNSSVCWRPSEHSRPGTQSGAPPPTPLTPFEPPGAWPCCDTAPHGHRLTSGIASTRQANQHGFLPQKNLPSKIHASGPTVWSWLSVSANPLWLWRPCPPLPAIKSTLGNTWYWQSRCYDRSPCKTRGFRNIICQKTPDSK